MICQNWVKMGQKVPMDPQESSDPPIEDVVQAIFIGKLLVLGSLQGILPNNPGDPLGRVALDS